MSRMNRETTLGGAVRDRRLALGYSLGQLATKVNKTAASIRSWERGDTVPTEQETDALSDALDLDAELLISLRGVALTKKPVKDAPIKAAPAEEAAVDSLGPAVDVAVADELPTAEPEAELEGQPPTDRESDDDSVEQAAEDDDATVAEVVAPEVEPPEEHPDIDSETQGGEALADAVAALATADFDEGHDALAEAGRAGITASPAIHEAMTEAVPVVPSGVVAVGAAAVPTDKKPVTADAYRAPVSSNPVVQAWDNVVDTYHRIFDPRRKWIYRVRWILLLVAFYIMLRVLAWAGGELWDAIGEVLDGIAFTPSETPDVSN